MSSVEPTPDIEAIVSMPSWFTSSRFVPFDCEGDVVFDVAIYGMDFYRLDEHRKPTYKKFGQHTKWHSVNLKEFQTATGTSDSPPIKTYKRRKQ